ncbi:MAG: hypothetical protein HKN47_15580 [Pirellulaceae bacterium]|nr:hypothetical protein [Pirellulaceae bacterium]
MDTTGGFFTMTTNSDPRANTDAIGVMFGRDQLDGCRASQTMFGTVRYQRATVTIVDGDIDTALRELLGALGAGSTPLPLVAAIPTDECYFATRPTASGAANASPRVLLRESLRSSATRLDQMAIDVINWQPDRRSVAGIVAAPIDRIERIRECVAATGHLLQRLEPAAACLISIAPECEGRDRRSSLTTRVMLGEQNLLAVMSRGTRPIYWQNLPLPHGDEATGIVSAIRSLEAAGTACGVDRTPDNVVIHGRRELHALIDQQWLEANLHSDFRWVETPTLAAQDVAQGLVDKFLNDDDDGFDFVRQHRDPLQLRRVVPYKEILVYAATACALATVMWLRLGALDDQKVAVLASAPMMVADGANPKPEKDQLNARAAALSQFLDKRVHWSTLLGDIAHVMPQGMRLTGIRGTAAMTTKRKKQVKVSPTTLVLQAETALDDDGAMPSSLDTLADSIHRITSVSSHFGSVELSDIRRTRSSETGVAGAEFSIILTNDSKGAL